MNITIKKCLTCGVAHDWMYDQPTLRELRHIKARTGMSVRQYADGLTSGDPDATTALIDLLHRRVGVELRWEDIDLDFDDFEIEQTEAESAAVEQGKDDGAAGEPSPTGEPTEVV